MKKLSILTLLLCAQLGLFADEKSVYCEIVGTSTSFFGTDVTINLDFGQERKRYKGQTLVDELGAPIVFNSMIDALNWMGERGWEFAQAYVVTSDFFKQNVYHFLLTKKIKDGEAIDAGIRTLEQMKNPDESTKEEMAKYAENKAYVALLMKTQKFDSKFKDEVSRIFPFDEILQLIQSKSVEELKTLSKKHSIYFNKYEIEN